MSTNDDDNCGGSGRADRERRKRIAARHHRAAKDGIHLPSAKELLLGSPWLRDDLDVDAQTWSERMLPKLDLEYEDGHKIRNLLAQLTASPLCEDFWRAREAVMDLIQARDVRALGGMDADLAAVRLEYYAASTGCKDACLAVASRALYFANTAFAPTDESAAFTEAALGWLSAAATARPQRRHRERFSSADSARREALKQGEMLANEIICAAAMLASDQETVSGKSEEPAQPVQPPEPAPRTMVKRGNWSKTAPTTVEQYLGGLDDEDRIFNDSNSAIVIPLISDPDTTEGKLIAKSYAEVVGKRLPFVPKPDDMVSIQASLAAEFPHAAGVIARVFQELEGADYMRLRQPVIFVGERGCAKTTLSQRLLAELSVKAQVYNCGGVSDASMAGTPRQWSTGIPSLPVSAMRRHMTASPGIILDEIGRVGTGIKNGNILDALLGMMEPESSKNWFDPYLAASVNLSHVLWLATANSLEAVDLALRDRCILLRVPNPGFEHLEVLGNRMMKKAVVDKGLPEAWALPLDGTELAALADTLPQTYSLRALRRLIEGVLAARDVPTVMA